MAGRTRRVVWTGPARDALDSALAYIAEDSAEAAAEVLDVVLRTGASFNQLCRRGRIVPELSDASLREVFIYSYRLLYRVTKRRFKSLRFSMAPETLQDGVFPIGDETSGSQANAAVGLR